MGGFATWQRGQGGAAPLSMEGSEANKGMCLVFPSDYISLQLPPSIDPRSASSPGSLGVKPQVNHNALEQALTMHPTKGSTLTGEGMQLTPSAVDTGHE